MVTSIETARRYRMPSPIPGHLLDDERVAAWVATSDDADLNAAVADYKRAAAGLNALQARQPELQREIEQIDLAWLDAAPKDRAKLIERLTALNTEATAYPRQEPLAQRRLKDARRAFIERAMPLLAAEMADLHQRLAPADEELATIKQTVRVQPNLFPIADRLGEAELAKLYARLSELSAAHADERARLDFLNDLRGDISASAA